MEDHRLLKKLPRITWQQAVIHAQHRQDAKERQRSGYAGTEGTTEILTIGKRKWCRLDTIEGIQSEGRVMRNCLENGDYDHLPGILGSEEYDGLYSLGEANGHSLITTTLWNGSITQAHERATRTVRQGFIPLLEALTNHVRERRKKKDKTKLKQSMEEG